MKALTISLIFTCLWGTVLAQDSLGTATENLINSGQIKDGKHKLETVNILDDTRYTISGEVEDGTYKFTLRDTENSDNKQSFTLHQFTPTAFRINFREKFKSLDQDDKHDLSDGNTTRFIENLFYRYTAQVRTNAIANNSPIAGTIYFDDEAIVRRVDRRNFKKLKREAKDSLKLILRKRKESTKNRNTTTSFLKKNNKKYKILKRELFENAKPDTIKTAFVRGIPVIGIPSFYYHPRWSGSKKKYEAKEELIEAFQKKLIDDRRSRYKKIDDKYKELSNQICQNEAEKETLKTEVDNLKEQVKSKETLVEGLKEKIVEQTVSMDKKNLHLARIEMQLRVSKNLDRFTEQNLMNEDSLNNILDRLKEENERYKLDLDNDRRNWLREGQQLERIKLRLTNKNDSIDMTEDILDSLNKHRLEYLAELQNAYLDLPYTRLSVKEVDIEFNEGFIENMQVTGTINEYDISESLLVGQESDRDEDNEDPCKNKDGRKSRKYVFINQYPIGFSRKIDYEALGKTKLYGVRKNRGFQGNKNVQYEIELADVIDLYIPEHKVGRRDFSPIDEVITYKHGDPSTRVLKKEETYKLFEAKVYSDFVGLDQTNPNGLIQTEIDRRVNILTERISSGSWINLPNFFRRRANKVKDRWNWGFLSYVSPSITISKIEDNNKYLPLSKIDQFINNRYEPVKYASTLDVKRYENFNAGIKLNLLLLDVPAAKSTFYLLNSGFSYGRTGVIDSVLTLDDAGNELPNERSGDGYGINTFQFYPEIEWEVKADERYNFLFSWRHTWLYVRDNSFIQVPNSEVYYGDADDDILGNAKRNRFSTLQLLATFRPPANKNGKLFFRYRYNWQQNYWNSGYHQAQVGYSFFLIGRNNQDNEN